MRKGGEYKIKKIKVQKYEIKEENNSAKEK